MCHDETSAQLTNRIDLDRGVVLPVAAGALVLLAALPLEDDELRAAAVVYDRAGHLRALDRGRAEEHAGISAADDECFELDRVAGLRVERRHLHGAALFDAELLAAGTYDCVSHFSHSSHTQTALAAPEKSFIIKAIPAAVKPRRRFFRAPFSRRPRRPTRPDSCAARRTAP